jgi:hypothetical protein
LPCDQFLCVMALFYHKGIPCFVKQRQDVSGFDELKVKSEDEKDVVSALSGPGFTLNELIKMNVKMEIELPVDLTKVVLAQNLFDKIVGNPAKPKVAPKKSKVKVKAKASSSSDKQTVKEKSKKKKPEPVVEEVTDDEEEEEEEEEGVTDEGSSEEEGASTPELIPADSPVPKKKADVSVPKKKADVSAAEKKEEADRVEIAQLAREVAIKMGIITGDADIAPPEQGAE